MGRSTDPASARRSAIAIIARLREQGHVAWLAGGCVRDELLGLTPTDFDIATSATPPQIRALFPSAHSVGEHFGVMLVKHEADVIEVATFRTDGVYADARRPESVTFANDVADAQRRDFTINAIFLDPTEAAPPALGVANDPIAPPATAPDTAPNIAVRGRVIDYVGGLDDLRAGVIRAVGNADDRLREDHLRALRAVRFAARLSFSIDNATSDAIRRFAADLRGVSRERVGDEVRRMLSAPSRASAARMLQDLALDEPALAEPTSSRPVHLLAHLRPLTWTRESFLAGNWNAEVEADHPRLNGPVPFPFALAAWAIDRQSVLRTDPESLAPSVPSAPGFSSIDAAHVATLTRQWRSALVLANDESDLFRDILLAHHALVTTWAGTCVVGRKRFVARTGASFALELLRSHDRSSFEAVARSIATLAADSIGLAPLPFVTGDDLVAAGLKPGPRFKLMLDRVYDAQLEGRVRTKPDAMELTRTLSV